MTWERKTGKARVFLDELLDAFVGRKGDSKMSRGPKTGEHTVRRHEQRTKRNTGDGSGAEATASKREEAGSEKWDGIGQRRREQEWGGSG